MRDGVIVAIQQYTVFFLPILAVMLFVGFIVAGMRHFGWIRIGVSDEAIKSEIRQYLLADPRFAAVSVEVLHGAVRFSGEVDDDRAWHDLRMGLWLKVASRFPVDTIRAGFAGAVYVKQSDLPPIEDEVAWQTWKAIKRN